MELSANFARLNDLVGIAGVFLYLVSYFLLQVGKIKGHGYIYPILIIIAASLVLYDLIDNFNVSAAFIQASFIVISLMGIGNLVIKNHTARFTDEEKTLLEAIVPKLDRARARKFLDYGNWANFPAGYELTTYDEPINALYYVTEGSVSCNAEGYELFRFSDGFFIGEITCFSGKPATATCISTTKIRCLFITAKSLRKITQNDHVMLLTLQAAFAEEMRRKIIQNNTNRKLAIAQSVTSDSVGSSRIY